MSFDDAEEARLDMAVRELLEVSSLENTNRHFGTLDIKKMPEGRVKRAIVYAWFNRLPRRRAPC